MDQWKTIYKAGAFASFLMAAFIPIQIAVFFVWPPPATVVGWFELFQMNKLIGLLDMDLLLIVDQVLMIFIFLTLYASLKKANPEVMTIALTLGVVGTATYFASGSAFEMLNLSNMYTAATTEVQRVAALTGGQLMLANWQGTAFNVAYVLQGVAMLLIAMIMLKSNVFGAATAKTAIVLGVLSLIPPTLGTIGLMISLASVVPLWIWAILIGRKFLQFSRT